MGKPARKGGLFPFLMSNLHYLTIKTQREFGWSWAFASAYAVEKFYNGMSHQRAFQTALLSPFVKQADKPA